MKTATVSETKERKFKRMLFAREYVVDFNATQAAIRAGYPKKNASSTASELLGIPYVLEYVQKFNYNNAEVSQNRKNRIVAEFESIAFNKELSIEQRQRALDSLARIEGMFVEKKLIRAVLSIEDVLEAKRKEIEEAEEAEFESNDNVDN